MQATVIGWGKTEGGGARSSARRLQVQNTWRNLHVDLRQDQKDAAIFQSVMFQELGVTVISQEECQQQWSYGRGRVEVSV